MREKEPKWKVFDFDSRYCHKQSKRDFFLLMLLLLPFLLSSVLRTKMKANIYTARQDNNCVMWKQRENEKKILTKSVPLNLISTTTNYQYDTLHSFCCCCCSCFHTTRKFVLPIFSNSEKGTECFKFEKKYRLKSSKCICKQNYACSTVRKKNTLESGRRNEMYDFQCICLNHCYCGRKNRSFCFVL